MEEPVKCPGCGRRLFDKEVDAIGGISIKCPVCRKVSKLKLEKSKIKLRSSATIPSNGVK